MAFAVVKFSNGNVDIVERLLWTTSSLYFVDFLTLAW